MSKHKNPDEEFEMIVIKIDEILFYSKLKKKGLINEADFNKWIESHPPKTREITLQLCKNMKELADGSFGFFP